VFFMIVGGVVFSMITSSHRGIFCNSDSNTVGNMHVLMWNSINNSEQTQHNRTAASGYVGRTKSFLESSGCRDSRLETS